MRHSILLAQVIKSASDKIMSDKIGIINICIIISLMGVAGAATTSTAIVADGINEVHGSRAGALPGTANLENDSFYKTIFMQSLVQYEEDLNHSSYILDEFVKKNITNREAMVAASSLYELSSRTRELIYEEKPTRDYAIYHNDTIHALSYLRDYLWDMAKFYETNKLNYALSARENFNDSLYYYGRARQGLNKTTMTR